jgi:hypothetical protein
LNRFILTLFVCVGLIFLVSCSSNSTETESQPESTHQNHEEANVEADLPEEETEDTEEEISPYTLDASIEQEGDKYFIFWDTNLTFSEENYGGAPVEGEGHVHLTINGLTDPLMDDTTPHELVNLRNGENIIIMNLANNNHALYHVSKDFVINYEKPE